MRWAAQVACMRETNVYYTLIENFHKRHPVRPVHI